MELWYVAVGPGLMTCILVYPAVSTISSPFVAAVAEVAYLEHVDRVHHRVFLVGFLADVDLTRRVRMRTAIPANAPASMFAPSEKFGGSAS